MLSDVPCSHKRWRRVGSDEIGEVGKTESSTELEPGQGPRADRWEREEKWCKACSAPGRRPETVASCGTTASPPKCLSTVLPPGLL